MTLMDRLGKFIARRLYRYARKHPGKPTEMSYANRVRADRFCKAWPWSWKVSTSR